MRGPVLKGETAQLRLDGFEEEIEHMFTNNNTTYEKTVKIFAPFRLNAAERRVVADGKHISIAAPAGRQQGDYLYSTTVTLLHEGMTLYTSAPCWASVEIR